MQGPGIPVYDNMSFLLERLDLTDSQLSKIADIRSSMEKELVKLGAEVASLNIDLKNLFLTTDKIDAKIVKSLIKKINNARGKMFEIRTMSRIKMINILNREQRKELKEIMLEHPRGRRGRMRYYRK
jgi:Spy/CpxP family protein refolding chaperone